MIDFNRDLAIAKQYFEELASLTTIEALMRGEYATGAKRQRIQELLGKLVVLLIAIDKELSAQLDNTNDAPIMQISSGPREFYTSVLEPNFHRLRDIYFDISELAELKARLENRGQIFV
jgi:hypothetical protein